MSACLAAKVLHHRSAARRPTPRRRFCSIRAIALDPNYAHAHAWKACVLGQTWVYGGREDRDATFQQVAAELQSALALDDNDSDVHRILAAVNLTRDDHDKGGLPSGAGTGAQSQLRSSSWCSRASF
jgi:adenylate cyclase